MSYSMSRHKDSAEERKEKADWMTWMGRWSLQGDVLAGDQSHQLAGKHRDAETPAAEARQRPPAIGLTTHRDEIINVLIHSLSHAALIPRLPPCPCLALFLCLFVRLSATTERLNAQSCTAQPSSRVNELSRWLRMYANQMSTINLNL